MLVPDKGENPWLSAPVFRSDPCTGDQLRRSTFPPASPTTTPAQFLPGLATLPGSEEGGPTAPVAHPRHASAHIGTACLGLFSSGADVSHHGSNRLVANAKVSGERPQAHVICKDANLRLLLLSQPASTNTISTGCARVTPRWPLR